VVKKGGPVPNTLVEVSTVGDGTLVVQPHGPVGIDCAAELRHILVRAVRKIRPWRVMVDLSDVSALDPIGVGTLAAACHVGDDDNVIVSFCTGSAVIASRLAAAGVPPQRLRQTR
jgi:anti-anti-sigma regulatory factor